ncbi:MAG: SMP-30/gluconolactonase/LRE family protein [Ignavibacteriaceae bacterium]|nr:SMP-30/gluconolactonase/LRE family protein [Ignavibacterium sp.]MCC6255417.1 SMP-30/gluconolactonase/LRE family protein [Ignavibacteriaceae bacterium]HRN25814.1 SMP-30/gluconolactonase/LRE family protein [Ignavibacteriaceae bacterium]HRP93156.1 SMP-30/gluconolactonase/LRE family protein [Ignavibacteriaceae bacterium]HRQ53503.1 SMP-30/gluconolactonase/LRE family protein [Ignavibacteriaceae bacterium]
MKKYLQTIVLFGILLSIVNFNLYPQVIDKSENWIKVAEGLNFPEGPAYDGKASVYFSNCYGGWIAKYSAGITDTFVSISNDSLLIEKTNGLACGVDGNLYVCEYGKGQILRINKNAQIEVLADGYDGKRFNRPNDIIIDENGNLFFTDPKSYDKNILDGRIFFVDVKTKEVFLLDDSLAFPNGINISPIDGKLYVCESAKQKIVRFTITNDIRLINKENFVELPGGDPDGIEFDEMGNIYVAHFGGKAIYIFSPEGKLQQKIETPGSKPSNLEFGDRDYKTLFLTEDETNSLYKIRTNYPGKNILNKN